MADVNANIGVNIDTSLALAQLKSLQRQISQFHTSIARSSESAALAQKSLQKNFLNSVNSIGAFSAELRTVKSTTESFTSSLEGNKFSMREYFRYAGGATKTFGRLFKSEFDTIGKVAEERVKRLQTQYIKMGRDASGAMQAIAITPTSLDMENYGTKTAIAAQKQALFNQLMKQGSTNLLNFGKNTQWAGRQLMVGFTIPLAMVGSAATKTFMEMEAQTIKFKKVYGDLFTPEAETQEALDNIKELGRQFTQYGVAVSTTVGLAAEAAAAGFSGLDLQRQTSEATRLSILGQIDTQKALETTISLQNAFGMSSDKLADSINFLNAVENQTVVSLDDITTAIPKVAPVIQQLGGDVKDLTFFMAAMKEGGINASEGANALKSGLAALINPTGRANEMLKGFGINASEIVTKNKGNLKATVVEFATALNQLDPLNRAQAIEQMFGKFQFARLSTLFANVAKDGNQAARVLDLANSSVEELSSLSEKELGLTAESSMNKFKKAVEDLKFSLIPVGKAFLEAVTPIVEFVGGILEKFGNLSDGTKKAITIITVLIGGIGPIALMAFGLLANGIANILKLFGTLRNGYLRLTGQSQVLGNQTQYLTMEQIEAASASHSLNQAHARLTQQFTAESAAVNQLILAYQGATRAGAAFAMANPGSMLPRRKGYANGVVSVPGSGKGDTVPAMLTPGEAVIPAAIAKKYAPLINGMIAGNIPGYRLGRVGREASGGELAQRNVSGGYDLSHIGGIITKTGQELLKLAETQTQNTRRLIEKLVENSKDGINTIFDVLDNRITVQSKELNQAVGETGSGRKAPIELFKRDAIERSGAFNAPLLVQMEEAGASQEELQSAVSEITGAITLGLEDLSGQTTITAEEIDNLVQKAYKVVGETNAKVKDAYTKMQEPGALKEVAGTGVFGRQGLRGGYNTPTQKKKVSAMVQKMSPETYPTQQAFVFTGEAARKVGIQNAEEIAKIFDQLSKEAKRRVQTLLGDINAMSAQVVAEAKSAGIDMGKSAITGVALGAKTASPSKDTIKTGEDIGKGLEIGLESRKDEVAATGTSLGKVATQSVSRGAKTTGPITPGEQYNIQKTQGGVPISQVTRNAPVPPQVVQQASLQARMMQMSSDRLQKFDRNIMGASFAVSSLAGVASMSGGKLGAMSGVISKVTGAMFALQAITGLLAQTKALELAQSRLGMASTAMKMAKGTQGGGMVGVAGKAGVKGSASIMGSLARVGLGLAKFVGPLGGVALAATAAFVAFKYIKGRIEKSALEIQGLGNAALLTSEQLNKLGPLLGFTPGKNPFEGIGKETKVVSDPQAKMMAEIKTTLKDDKTFQENIQSVKEATDAQIKSVLTAQSVSLLAQGAPKENVQAYIDALLEEAGKAKIEFKVASVDLSSKKGQAEVIKNTKSQIKNFNKVYDKAMVKEDARAKKAGAYYVGEGYTKKIQKTLQPNAQKNASLIPKALVANLGAIKTSLEKGTIGLEEYKAAVNGLVSGLESGQGSLLIAKETIKAMAGDDAQGKLLKNAATGITNNADAILVLQAATAGIPDIIGLIDSLKVVNSGTATPAALAAAQAAIATAQKNIAKRTADQIAASKVKPDNFIPPGNTPTEKNPYEQATDQLKQQQKEMVNTVTSYNKLTKAGVKAGKAFAIAKDPILAAAVATTKVGTDAWKKLIKLIKETDTALIKSKLTELKADTAYTEQFTKIVPVLKKLGLNAEEIDNIFSDPSFAQQFIKGIKNGKINAKDLKNLIDETVKNREIDIKFNLSKETADETFDRLMNEAMSRFSTIQTGVEFKYEGQIRKEESVVKKAEDVVAGIQKEIDLIEKDINVKQRSVEENITRKIEEFQKDIEDLQEKIKTQFEIPLSRLSDEGDILSNRLSLIDRQESSINKKYDDQAAALTKISEINSDIAGQQKQQLGLADALSRGDISAAAAAVQELRATAAAKAQEKQSGILEAARARDLSKIQIAGMTRLGIEERQFAISQESFTLQQARKVLEEKIANIETLKIKPLNDQRVIDERTIRDLQDRIYNLQLKKLVPAEKELSDAQETLKATQGKLAADLAILEQKRESYLEEKNNRELEALAAGKYKELLIKTQGAAKSIVDKMLELNDTFTSEHRINTVYTTSGSRSGSAGGGRVAVKAKGGLIDPVGFANGNYSVGDDTVPAMLSPGEYVLRKSAVKKYGVDKLDAMNVGYYDEGGEVSKFASRPKFGTRPKEKDNFFESYVRKLTKSQEDAGKMLPSFMTMNGKADALGLGSLLRKLTKQGQAGDTLSAALFPLNFLGMGKISGSGIKATKEAAEPMYGIGQSLLKSTKALPAAGLDLARSGIWKTFGNIKAVRPLLYRMNKIVGNRPTSMSGTSPFSAAYKFAKSGKGSYEKWIESIYSTPRPSSRPGSPPRKDNLDMEDFFKNFVPKSFKPKPTEQLGETFGMISKLTKDKISDPFMSKIGLPMASKFDSLKSSIALKLSETKEGFKFYKEYLMPRISDLNPKTIASNFLYRYTSYGSKQALKKTKSKSVPAGDEEGSYTLADVWRNAELSSDAPPELLSSLEALLQKTFYHGGNIAGNLVNRSKPGIPGTPTDNFMTSKTSVFDNLFDFDLFTTGSPGMASTYAQTKNTSGFMDKPGDIFEMLFPNAKGSTTWDLRGGQPSLWSQNKRAYAVLEAALARTIGIKQARLALLGERVPGIAKVALNQSRDQWLHGENLRLLFTKLGPKGFYNTIDTIVHEGGRNTGSVSHPVVATIAPEKVVTGFKKILDGTDLKFFEKMEVGGFDFRTVSSEVEKTLTDIVLRSASQKSTIGRVLPFLQEGAVGKRTIAGPKDMIALSKGGMVPKYMAVGGRVGSDTVPAMLTPGEFVMNKAASKRFGPMLEAMNNSKYPSMIKDLTPTTYSNVSSSISMPISSNLSSTVNDNSSTMYNYNVGINVNESNASSGDIARAVIGQIKYIDSQRLRGQR